MGLSPSIPFRKNYFGRNSTLFKGIVSHESPKIINFVEDRLKELGSEGFLVIFGSSLWCPSKLVSM